MHKLHKGTAHIIMIRWILNDIICNVVARLHAKMDKDSISLKQERQTMRHIKRLTITKHTPGAAMGTGDILLLVGTILTGVGSVLMGISPFFGGKGGSR